jgi:hypothetical protein
MQTKKTDPCKVFAMFNTKATNKITGKNVTIMSADLHAISNDMLVEHGDVVEVTELPKRRIPEL